MRLEELNLTEKNKPQIEMLADMIGKSNIMYKRMSNQSVEDDREVKKIHEESLRLDTKLKRKATIIK